MLYHEGGQDDQFVTTKCEIIYYYLIGRRLLDMPIITVALYSGRSQREKDRLAEAITEDTVKILKVERKDIIVLFEESPHGNWYASGVRL
ncbi:MAG: 4-oxalocrotonate tautomerase family protein [Nitrososphaeraceae archaeon]